jgi:hypothetical protein
VHTIEQATGLDFGSLRNNDPGPGDGAGGAQKKLSSFEDIVLG